MQVISQKYTLFSRIPVFFDGSAVLTDPLWAKDLVMHLSYLTDFILCCPVEPLTKAPENATRVDDLPADRVIALRRDYSRLSVLRNFIPNFFTVFRAVHQTTLVHSGGAGWGFPLSFYILVLAPFQSFIWIMVIESAFWMKPENGRVTARQWIRHHVHRLLLRSCLSRADARIFTTDAYRRFFDQPEDTCLIAPAIWVDDSAILTQEDQDARLEALPEAHIKLLFPARLAPEKGPQTVLDAITYLEKILPKDAPCISIDIMGAGPEAENCQTFARRHKGFVSVEFLEPISYETEFLPFLRGYHALLLANRYHEQPRVVFDGFSQGLPIISSDTEGVQEISTEGENAFLYPVDDAKAMAHAILAFMQDNGLRKSMANAALSAARGNSHAAMHEKRLTFLRLVFGQKVAENFRSGGL